MQVSIEGSSTVELLSSEPNGSIYQSSYTLSFAKDNFASGITLQSFNLDGDFKAKDINVLAADAPLKASIEKSDANTWIVRLPRPMTLTKINIEEVSIFELAMAEVFIAEGFFDFMLPELMLSVGAAVAVNNKQQRIRDAAREALNRGEKLAIAAAQLNIYPVVGDKVLNQSIATLNNNSAINSLVLEAFAVRTTDLRGKNLLAAQHNISVFVHSQPQGLKVALAPLIKEGANAGKPDLDNKMELAGLNLQSNQDLVALTGKNELWQAAAQTFLDAHFKNISTPSNCQMAVVLQSETPCQFVRKQFVGNYLLSFIDQNILVEPEEGSDAAQTRSLVMDGNRWQIHTLTLILPSQARLLSASLKYKANFNKEPFAFLAEPPEQSWLANALGVELNANHWAGGVFQLPKASSVQYLLIPIMANQANCRCSLEIREDVNGRPVGAIVAQQTILLAAAGERTWAVVPLDEPVNFFSQKLWWLAKTHEGSAVQFVDVEVDTSGDSDGESLAYFKLSGSGGPGSLFRNLPNAKVKPLFAKATSAGEKAHFFIQQGDAWVNLGPSAQAAARTLQQNLLPLLPNPTVPGGTVMSLYISSLLKGKLDIYPPQYTYELLAPV